MARTRNDDDNNERINAVIALTYLDCYSFPTNEWQLDIQMQFG